MVGRIQLKDGSVGKALAAKPDDSNGGKREPTPTNCPLTSHVSPGICVREHTQ